MGGRSRAAAQLLSGQGFEKVYNLAGGIKAWRGATASGPAEAGMESITGEETSEEMLAIVYGMEEGMRSFYEELGRRAEDEALAVLFEKLSRIEVEHEQLLIDLYEARFPGEASAERLKARARSAVAEGGVSSDELLAAHGTNLRATEDVLDLAMSLETQALDLYLRYARRVSEPRTQAVLRELADEEKRHLAFLGDLLEARKASG